MDSRKRMILEATVMVFNEKGIKFTVDDITSVLGISKKTIYKLFESKEAILNCVVEYYFDMVNAQKRAIVDNPSLSTIEKLRCVLCKVPDVENSIDYMKIYTLKDKYPSICNLVKEKLDSGWENIKYLVDSGVEEGVLRTFDLSILRMILKSSIEKLILSDVLAANNITYENAMKEVVDILLDGILVDKF